MELWDLYTADRQKTDRKMIRGEKQPKDFYRLVVHLCIFNTKGEMLIQQRHSDKVQWSNMWDISVGGSAISGETSNLAVSRELYEELGVKLSFKNIRPSLAVNFDKGFDDIYLIEQNLALNELNLQETEVQSVKWSTHREILQMIDETTFIPYHKSLITLLFSMRTHTGIHAI